ncbi:MAG TPA: CusA/CzcA family heavy metal efflux RND transporter [Methylomirabilota bacterium]|nr:CusA/CzcA family heavy metal efflux RND transporter [Methylomirabilota bacterium]
MLAGLLGLALRHRVPVLVAVLALAGAGIWAFKQLKLEAYPDISDTGVVVVTLYPGFAAEEVEQQVTIPIERALNNTARLISRRSRTIFGLSIVELTFAEGTNDYFARQLVLDKLRDATLPDGVTPTLAPLSTGVGEFYRYVLVGKGYDAMRLRELQDWVVTPRLLQIPGVADVTIFGGLVRQYEIQLDPKALNKYKFSVRQVADAVKNNNRNAGGALLTMGHQSLAMRGSGLIRSSEDIGNIVLDAQKNVPVYIRDVGRVTVGHLPPTGIFAMNRDPLGPGGVEGIVLLLRWENASEVLARIHEAVDELNQTRLPQGVQIVAIHDQTELVESTVHTISRVLIEGFVVVVSVLLLFLVSLRAALLTAVIIPLSLLFAFLCMYLSGVTLSLLSIGALDFGILVDATIVMVERIVRTLEERGAAGSSEELTERVRAAGLAVQRPILFSLSIIIAAYIPLLTLERVERRLFTPMALTVCYALVGSLVLCLTLVPVLATFVFRGPTQGRRHRVLDGITGLYERVIRVTVRHAVLTMVAAFAVVIGSVYVGTHLGTEFMPLLDEGEIWIRANLPSGISLEQSAEVAARMRAMILESPEVRLVSSQTGRNDSGTDPFGPNRNEILVTLKPYNTWTRGKTKADLVEELSRRIQANIPGVALNFTQPIIDMSTEDATGSSADLAVVLSGPDLKTLREIARQTLEVVHDVPGAADTSIEQEADQAQVRIQIDRTQVARYALNVGDVQDVIDLALGGNPITGVFEGDRRFDVVARFVPEARADPTTVGALLIPTRDGGSVPLSQLADIRVADGATIIARRENQRQMTVRTNIRGRDQGGFVADAQARLTRMVPLPPGYRVIWSGMFENFERARARLMVIVPVTIAIIFSLLFITFGSALDALLVLLNVPFSLAGGLILLSLRGIHLSVSAVVGFISLFGVAVMSGLLYISEINARRIVPNTPLLDAVIGGARAQFRPRLILIVVAGFGMLPAALARGIGSDIQRPLATVVVGGLSMELLLTLLALPAVYWLAARWRKG